MFSYNDAEDSWILLCVPCTGSANSDWMVAHMGLDRIHRTGSSVPVRGIVSCYCRCCLALSGVKISAAAGYWLVVRS